MTQQIFGAYILIKYKDRYIFQKRDELPNISSPGLLSTFGGHIEKADKDNFLNTAKRELQEETTLNVENLEFIKLGIVSSDKGSDWAGEVYLVEINDDHFQVLEGQGFVELTKSQIKETNRNKFALSTNQIIDNYILKTN